MFISSVYSQPTQHDLHITGIISQHGQIICVQHLWGVHTRDFGDSPCYPLSNVVNIVNVKGKSRGDRGQPCLTSQSAFSILRGWGRLNVWGSSCWSIHRRSYTPLSSQCVCLPMVCKNYDVYLNSATHPPIWKVCKTSQGEEEECMKSVKKVMLCSLTSWT
jgi:hypothetical protein